MGSRKWIKPEERKWDLSRLEKGFETYLKSNGFVIDSVRELISFTDYRICKGGITQEYRLYPNKVTSGNSALANYNAFLAFYEVTKEHEELLAKHS